MSAAKRVGGKVFYSLLDGPHLCIGHEGVKSRIYIRAADKNRPPSLVIKRDNPLPFSLYILSAESPQTVLYQYLCRGTKIKTQDGSLDEKLIIKSDTPGQAELFIQNTEKIEAIKFLVENGYEKIIAKKNKIMIQKSGYSEEDFEPERVNTVINHLSSLSL